MKELFYTGDGIDALGNLIMVVGNHDVGFHYDMGEHKLERFNRSFGTRYLTLHAAADALFVSVNSMAMENDGCRLCVQAQRELKRINSTLECLKKRDASSLVENNKECKKLLGQNRAYSKPILFTHFPLFRKSDSICPREVDSEFSTIGRNPEFRPRFDSLSLESTQQVRVTTKYHVLFYLPILSIA